MRFRTVICIMAVWAYIGAGFSQDRDILPSAEEVIAKMKNAEISMGKAIDVAYEDACKYYSSKSLEIYAPVAVKIGIYWVISYDPKDERTDFKPGPFYVIDKYYGHIMWSRFSQ